MQTKYFGDLEFTTDAVFTFPEGLLGFSECRRFVLIDYPGCRPLSFLQNVEDRAVCFPVIPAAQADGGFRLLLDPESRGRLALPESGEPYAPGAVLALAIVSFDESGAPRANLKGPVVLNVAERLGRQVVQFDAEYAIRHPVEIGESAPCS